MLRKCNDYEPYLYLSFQLVYVTDKFSESLSAEARKRKKMEAEEYAEVSFADARKPKKLE